MAELNLRTVNFNLQRSFPNYVISSVIDCDWGHRGIKLIQTPEELDRFYEGSEDRDGLISLLEGGSSLLISRLNRTNTKSPTLRIYNNPYKSSHPEVYDYREYPTRPSNELISLNPTFQDTHQELIDDVNLNETLTYSIVLDFNDNIMTDEDYIAIPKYFDYDPSFDNSVIFYFTDLNPINPVDRKFPNDFEPAVELGTLGSESLGIDINNVDSNDRAKIIHEWYLGTLVADPSKYSIIGTPGDSNLIPEQTILDEENNKLTLVFRRPIRNIRYFKSNGNTPFKISSERFLNQELISEANNSNSIISFNSKIEGDAEMDIKLEYVRRYEYNLTVTFDNFVNTHYVSIDRNVALSQGVSIFIEDVINLESDLIEVDVHLGTDIESGNFTEEDAKNMAGSYKISYGRLGSLVPFGNEKTPFQKSIDMFNESGELSNLFLFTTETSKEDQSYALENYLKPNITIGFVNIPESITEEEDLDEFLLEDENREIMLYTYGRSNIQNRSSLVRNSFWYSLNSISGNFKDNIPNNVFPIEIEDSIKSLLDDKKINYLSSNIEGYFIDYVDNFDSFLEPHYLLTANFVKTYITRFLQDQLGRYENDLREILEKEVSKLTIYSPLIDSINIDRYTAVENNLTVVIRVDLSGLVGRSIDVKININRRQNV